LLTHFLSQIFFFFLLPGKYYILRSIWRRKKATAAQNIRYALGAKEEGKRITKEREGDRNEGEGKEGSANLLGV
jgi:hypothetical protein